MISKQDLIQQMEEFRKIAKGDYYLPIPKTIVSVPTIEEAYLQIGRNSSDCAYYYDGIAYREDLYDILILCGMSHDDAYGIMQKVRKGLSCRINFEGYPIPQKLKDWCLGVRYLPSREIVTIALAERVNRIADNEEEFRIALLNTLPEYKYTPMMFIGATDELFSIRKEIYELSDIKGFLVEEDDEYLVKTYDIENKPVRIITITKENRQWLPTQDVIYEVLSNMISSGIPVVALIEHDCYVSLEERTKALLHYGVVCEI